MTPRPSIAHYLLGAKLGEGGMGAVYRATDSRLHRDVAVKILPSWSRNGRELFYLAADDRIMVVEYTAKGDSFTVGKPQVWSTTPVFRTVVTRSLDLHPDGKRFAVFPRPSEAPGRDSTLQVRLILNFIDEVRRRLP